MKIVGGKGMEGGMEWKVHLDTEHLKCELFL